MTCAFLVLIYGAERADGPQLGPTSESLDSHTRQISSRTVGLMYVLGSLAYGRFLYVVYQTMKEVRVNPQTISDLFWYRAALGAIVGAAVVIAAFFIDLWVSSPRQAPEIWVFAFPGAYTFRNFSVVQRILKKISNSTPLKIPFSPWKYVSPFLAKTLGPGYQCTDANAQLQLGPGHGFAGIFATACMVLYLMAGAGGHNRLYSDGPFGPPRPYEAVLLQEILLLLLACWLFSGISFYFDRFRVPILLPLGLVLFVTSHLGTSDHSYHTFARNIDTEASIPKPQERFAAAPDHVIAIAAAGGGIQAAAWTGQVLCGLSQEPEIGSAFKQSVFASNHPTPPIR
jgi:hypothetical protein